MKRFMYLSVAVLCLILIATLLSIESYAMVLVDHDPSHPIAAFDNDDDTPYWHVLTRNGEIYEYYFHSQTWSLISIETTFPISIEQIQYWEFAYFITYDGKVYGWNPASNIRFASPPR